MTEKTPQLEDGYTRINNPTLDALISFPAIPPHVRCLLYVMRMTWGYGRKSVILRPRDFVNACKIRRRHYSRTIKRTVEAKLINVTSSGDIQGARYSVNKKLKQWKMSPPVVTSPPGMANVTSRGDIHLYKRKEERKDIISGIDKPKKKRTWKPKHEFHYQRIVECPTHIYLNDTMRKYAIDKGMAIDRIDPTFEYFCDHHRSKGNKFKDWIAAWRKWVQKDIEFAQKREKESENVFDRLKRRIEETGSIEPIGNLPQ